MELENKIVATIVRVINVSQYSMIDFFFFIHNTLVHDVYRSLFLLI